MIIQRKKQPKRELALGLDHGTSGVKAALVRKQGDKFELVEYATRTLPPTATRSYRDKEFTRELTQLVEGLTTTERRAFVTISCHSAMICHTEFPAIPLAEIRTALKLNSARYLRRDFSNYYLDAFELTDPAEADKGKPRKGGKKDILVGGATREDVDACREALVAAKIKPEVIELAAVSIISAFNFTRPAEESADEAVLLVDIGGCSTTLNFLRRGQPLMTRIMRFGGVQVSEYIAQMTDLEAADAELAKLNMTDVAQELLGDGLLPLAREVRSSIDFFERQHDCRVAQVFACGASSASAPLMTALGSAVGIEIQAWNVMNALGTASFNGETPQLMALGPALAAAVGVAVARLS